MEHSRINVLRWQIGYGTFGIPQAAAPIAFALIALPITGSAESGAALVFAMTAAQILGSVPVSRLGTRFNGVGYLRTLIVIRTLGLLAVTLLAGLGAPFFSLMIGVIAAGAVNGAAYGFQRTLLNHLIEPAGLPRALGIAATLGEVSFALSPVLASVIGAASPVAAMIAVSVLSLAPLVLIPSVPDARGVPTEDRPTHRERVPLTAYLWLLCSVANGASVAAIEVGAVSFALSFGLSPAWAFLFALTLCIGSVIGGVWVSVRNRMPGPWKVVAFLTATTLAFGSILFEGHLFLTLFAACVVGFFLPVTTTFYSLALDRLAPPDRRAELFALLRTSNSLGVLVTSGLLALLGLDAALIGGLGLLAASTLLAAVHSLRSGPTQTRSSSRRIGADASGNLGES